MIHSLQVEFAATDQGSGKEMASDGAKIAWAIIVAAVIIVAGGVGYFEFTKWQIGEAARIATNELRKEREAKEAKRVREAQARSSAEHRANQSRWLRRGERCIGGKVMLPAPMGRAGWVMQYEDGQPVKCGGWDSSSRQYRLKPRPLAEQ